MSTISNFKPKWIPKNKKRAKGKLFDNSDFYNSKEWQRLRRSFFGMVWDGKKYKKTKNLLCLPCLDSGIYIDSVVADHIVPRNRGGKDEEVNLQPLCISCHEKKSAKEK
jgi:5-methylcytosine-specific restriction protein A